MHAPDASRMNPDAGTSTGEMSVANAFDAPDDCTMLAKPRAPNHAAQHARHRGLRQLGKKSEAKRS